MKRLTAGEGLRIVMKREKLRQIDIANNLGIDKRNVSLGLKNLDDNKGMLSTLVDYADSIGFDIEFKFVKREGIIKKK